MNNEDRTNTAMKQYIEIEMPYEQANEVLKDVEATKKFRTALQAAGELVAKQLEDGGIEVLHKNTQQ